MIIIKTTKDVDKLRELKEERGNGNRWVQAYKFVTQDGMSPMQRDQAIQYIVGRKYSVPNANTNKCVQCGCGINVASLQWCHSQMSLTERIIMLRFRIRDIAVVPVPTGTTGKFRVFRCKVTGALNKAWARKLKANIKKGRS